jgi:hypothetical protein
MGQEHRIDDADDVVDDVVVVVDDEFDRSMLQIP